MKNLSLQGEARHELPTRTPPCKSSDNDVIPVRDDDETSAGTIIAVVRNGNANLRAGTNNFGGHCSDGFRENVLNSEWSGDPPVVFVVTSAGILMALDYNDRLVWVANLEEAVDDSGDEYAAREDGSAEPVKPDAQIPRSRWFYASSYHEEKSPDTIDNDGKGDVVGTSLAGEGGLHLTCLSHAGHVVSVAIDDIATKDGFVQGGIECIGTFENGLECGEWSPDGEVLALVTFASGNAEEDKDHAMIEQHLEVKIPILMTMNTQYEIISEVRLDPCLPRSQSNSRDYLFHPNAISLCWRPDSSTLALSTMEANIDGKHLRRIRTYNRADLQIISVSKEEDGSGRDVPNLLPVAPTWAPGGCSHYLGAVQSSRPLSTKNARARQAPVQVVFMEPNGLRHRECKVQNTGCAKSCKEDVSGMAFNLDGDLLAVAIRVTSNETAIQFGKLQFYHRSNSIFYLKYELRYDGDSGLIPFVVSTIKFSDEDPYQITVGLNQTGQRASVLEWREYSFRWDSSTVHYRSSSVLAMAINGKKLNFTPLDKAVIPPPMYFFSLDLPAPAVGIATRPHFCNAPHEGLDVIVALSDGNLALLQASNDVKDGISTTSRFHAPRIFGTVDLSKIYFPTKHRDLSLQVMTLRDITIIDYDEASMTFVALSCSKNHQSVDNLFEITISWKSVSKKSENLNSRRDVKINYCLPLRGRALRITNWSDATYSASTRGEALLELIDGSILEYSQGGMVRPCDAGPLLETCPWIAGIYDVNFDAASMFSSDADGKHEISPKRLVFGLSSRYRLYCGERLLSNASSSFVISLQHNFISHITIGSRPQLRFLPLAELRDFDPLMGPEENIALDGYEPRMTERGARLVAIFPKEPTVVVQMPRGNLETVIPRALVLPYVMMKLQEGNFKLIVDIMRRQRIDMNLIVDMDPSKFLEKGGAEQFISQIEQVDNINLFVSSLTDVDVTLWKHPIPSWIKTTKKKGNPNKVNDVCQKIRQVMMDAEKCGFTESGKAVIEGQFLLPILSTFAKENPPKLKEALCLIKSSALSYSPKKPKQKSVLLEEHIQNSIQYLAFLADYELLFNTAIGMYDFDLAKAVARHSQMDPKEYIPMLNRWRELPEATARYQVDVKLKRYESALRYLVSSCKEEEETSRRIYFGRCLEFIEEHSLHKLGLELFQQDKESHRLILVSLGELLLSERKSEQALTIFLACKHLDGGKRASRACGDWRTYFACCAENGDILDSEQIADMAKNIASKACSMHEQRLNYASAASILLDYNHDVASAVDMLISAHSWSEARRVSYLNKRTDLVRKVSDGSVSYARICIEDFQERASTFASANKRYADVIVIRRNAIRKAEEDGISNFHLNDGASMFSMQSTSSNESLKSNASRRSAGSAGSLRSVASVSTVISVGSTGTFSLVGEADSTKHKSKFNTIGRNKKNKKRHKKKGPAARRIKAGSEDELNELIATLQHTCPDEHYVGVISETITFLLQVGKQSMATLLFKSYDELQLLVAQSQSKRLQHFEKVEVNNKNNGCEAGRIIGATEHPCEQGVNSISCIPLHKSVQQLLAFSL